MSSAFEINFDGLVGPTHHYGGLSFGNVASMNNKASLSSPKEAALQGLEKMKSLAELGLKQAILPPQDRPCLEVLRQLGFSGNDEQVLQKVRKEAPELLSAVWSGSSMWTANAATMAPSADTHDGKVHFTPANLTAKFHRFLEPAQTGRILQSIFRDPKYFVHHAALPSTPAFGDEGAANHTRLSESYGKKGLHFFVYGKSAYAGPSAYENEPRKFPARQTLEASKALARLHGLDENNVVYAQQTPEAIDAGAFHNDVVAVGNLDTLFYHEKAYVHSKAALEELRNKFSRFSSRELRLIEVPADQVSLEDAVKSYLFNSQLISLPGQSKMMLIAPQECLENPRVSAYLEQLLRDPRSPIQKIQHFNLRQSMRNGGGPACLRLRVVLTEEEIQKSHPGVYFSNDLYLKLKQWVNKNYREQLFLDDLVDPRLITEVRSALNELTQILGLPGLYSFQK